MWYVTPIPPKNNQQNTFFSRSGFLICTVVPHILGPSTEIPVYLPISLLA